MAAVRIPSSVAAHYGSLERHFDRPGPARIRTAPVPEGDDDRRVAKVVRPRHDVPHLGRLLDIYA